MHETHVVVSKAKRQDFLLWTFLSRSPAFARFLLTQSILSSARTCNMIDWYRSEEIQMPEQCKASTQHEQSMQWTDIKLVSTIAAVFSTVALLPIDTIFVVAPVTTPVDTSLRDLGTSSLHTSPPAIPDKSPRPLHDTLVAKGAQCLGLFP